MRPGQCDNNSAILKVNINTVLMAPSLKSYFVSALGEVSESSHDYSTLSLAKPKVILLHFTFEITCPAQGFSFLNSALIKEK